MNDERARFGAEIKVAVSKCGVRRVCAEDNRFAACVIADDLIAARVNVIGVIGRRGNGVGRGCGNGVGRGCGNGVGRRSGSCTCHNAHKVVRCRRRSCRRLNAEQCVQRPVARRARNVIGGGGNGFGRRGVFG